MSWTAQELLTAVTVAGSVLYLVNKLVLAPARRERGPHVPVGALLSKKRARAGATHCATGDAARSRTSSSSAGSPKPGTETRRP